MLSEKKSSAQFASISRQQISATNSASERLVDWFNDAEMSFSINVAYVQLQFQRKAAAGFRPMSAASPCAIHHLVAR
jgi:hypothetical protein